MKKESDKTILDKLDEIGSPIHNILEGTEGEYKGFIPIEIPQRIDITKRDNKGSTTKKIKHKIKRKKHKKKKNKRRR